MSATRDPPITTSITPTIVTKASAGMADVAQVMATDMTKDTDMAQDMGMVAVMATAIAAAAGCSITASCGLSCSR